MSGSKTDPAGTYHTFAAAIADGLPFRSVHVNTAGDLTFLDHNENSVTLTFAEGVSHPDGGKQLTAATAVGYVIRG